MGRFGKAHACRLAKYGPDQPLPEKKNWDILFCPNEHTPLSVQVGEFFMPILNKLTYSIRLQGDYQNELIGKTIGFQFE